MKASHRTNWYLFRSKEAKEICDHMTTEESAALQAFGSKYGNRFVIILSALSSVSISLGSKVMWGQPIYKQLLVSISSSLLISIAIFYFVGKHVRKKARELLCSTAYARQSGFSPQTLRLYSVGASLLK